MGKVSLVQRHSGDGVRHFGLRRRKMLLTWGRRRSRRAHMKAVIANIRLDPLSMRRDSVGVASLHRSGEPCT